jgi:DNA-binding beta-propeller fold protein YncE
MAELNIGEVFAGHRIDAIAGWGGMGVVYRATDLELDRRVALKVITPDLAEDPEFRERFKRESRLAAAIHHPNVVTVHSAGEENGQLFITMHFVEGTDLKSIVVQGGALDPDRAVAIVQQVAAALDAAHARGLIHRDVKPANVLVADVGDTEHAYLTDFGLTKLASSGGSSLTASGGFVGTIDYVAPEQVEGGRVDGRADVYALGCVLFHVLSGSVPFPEPNTLAKIYAHAQRPPPSLAEHMPSLPGELDGVVKRAMAKDPDDRYPSAGDLGRAARAALEQRAPSQPEREVAVGEAASGLRSSLEDTRVVAEPDDVTRVGGRGGSTVPGREPADTASGARRPRRRPLLLGASALAALAVVLVVVLGGGGDGGDDRPAGPQVVDDGIPVGSRPWSLAVGEGFVWVTHDSDGTLGRIDPDTGRLAGTPQPVGQDPTSVAVDDGVVLVANHMNGTIVQVDPGSGRTVGEPIEIGGGLYAVGLDFGEAWTANLEENTAYRVDYDDQRILDEREVGDGPIAIAPDGDGSFWIANSGGTVNRIDPGANPTDSSVGDPIQVGNEPAGIAVGGGYVWVALASDDAVARINLETDEVDGVPIAVGARPIGIAFGEGYVWVANQNDDTVVRINPRSGRVVGRPIRVGDKPNAVAVGEGSVWVSNEDDESVTRIDPGGD